MLKVRANFFRQATNFYQLYTNLKHSTIGWRKVFLAVSVLLFAIGLFYSLHATPDIISNISILPFATLFLLCLCAQPALNAVEFRIMVNAAGKKVSWLEAFEVSLFASASNMLPIPGGAITRIAAMRSYGVTTKQAISVTIMTLFIWGAFVAFVAAGWLFIYSYISSAAIILAAALMFVAAAFMLLRKFSMPPYIIGNLVAIRGASMALEAARLFIAFQAIGVMIAMSEATILITSSFIGSLVAVAPSGIGVREAVVAALSPLIGVEPTIGFLSSVVNRVAGILALLTISIPVLISSRKRHGDSTP